MLEDSPVGATVRSASSMRLGMDGWSLGFLA